MMWDEPKEVQGARALIRIRESYPELFAQVAHIDADLAISLNTMLYGTPMAYASRFKIADFLARGLGAGVFSKDELRPVIRVLHTAAITARDPSHVLNLESLPSYSELLKTGPCEGGHAKVMEHAIEAHHLGVPADKIFQYQMEIAKKGHFPNAGLIQELHKIKMKEAGRKK